MTIVASLRSSRLLLAAALLAASAPALARPQEEPVLVESIPTAAPVRLPADAIEPWRDEGFRTRFAESYLAESDVEPKLTTSEGKQIQKILDLIGEEKTDDAIAALRKQVADESSSAVFDFTLGNLLFQADQLDEARVAFEGAVKKFPKFRRAWRNLGLIHLRQQRYPDAIPALARVIELGGSDSVTYGLLGFSYANVADDLAAESCYRMAIVLDPKTLDWRMNLARSLFNQQRFADAGAICARLIADDPTRGELWLLQANAYLGLGQPLKAAENYELVERLGQATADSLLMLGDIYVNAGLFDLAVSAHGRAMGLAPRPAPDRAIRAAKVLVARAAYAETKALLDALEKAYGTDLPEETRKDLLRTRARVAVAEGAGDEQARVLQELISIDPLDGEALILLGQERRRAGDFEKAEFYFERAEAIEKFEGEAKLRHGQMLVALGRYPEALPMLRRALELKPSENLQRYVDQVERVSKGR